MTQKSIAALLLALLVAVPAVPLHAGAADTPAECQRFASDNARPTDLKPRLARLCVRLIEAHRSEEGMTSEERDAATRLGHYLGVLGELGIRRGAISIGGASANGPETTKTARYLIAQRIGLLRAADRLAPDPRTAELR